MAPAQRVDNALSHDRRMRTGTRFQQHPSLCVLSTDQLEEIHLATLEILAGTGVKVFDEGSLALLRSRGAAVDGTRMRIPAALVAAALASAPCRVRVADREGAPAMSLERGRVYFGTGSDVPSTFDLETGAWRPTRKQDVADFARLADALDHIDFVMAMGMAGELPEAAGMVRRILRGLRIDRHTLALELIEKVGPGGSYFAEEHTVESFRDGLHFAELANRGGWSRWQAEGGLGSGERAGRRAGEILREHRCPELPAGRRPRL